ncbi:MAG: metallophosphoesterase [Deltaproteobacteria bacterium]|nr:metallophosphoesterase [Deltaproteobacteria bacterium]MBW1948608.1 metallophosphoesterase [Deltaproteobacteria bacterium]MBW2007942.1 metallophosphoesterase [Deltaproteobacteria bacterium]
MTDQKTFIVGDIHGCLDPLKRLMDRLDWRPVKDRLIFLGDYIDRGPDPPGVVEYILELFKQSDMIECLIGNHEALFLDYLSGKDRRLFLLNGGTETLQCYHRRRRDPEEDLVPQDHLLFYHGLKPYVELDDFYLVHAGFRPGVEIKRQTLEDMTWIRDPFIFSTYDFGKRVIFGHTPFSEPLVLDNKIGLDTGAVYGNRLTCLELPEMRFHSVEAD